jgi:hypothetical protein
VPILGNLLKSAMNTITRTSLRKRGSSHFLVDGLQVWAARLDTTDGVPYGVRFNWMESPHSCSPEHHITRDCGNSYSTFESFISENCGLDMRISQFESNREKLDRLDRIWNEFVKQERAEDKNGNTPVEF